MLSYLDQTWCSDRECINKECFRHPSRIPDSWEWGVSISTFNDCGYRLHKEEGEEDES